MTDLVAQLLNFIPIFVDGDDFRTTHGQGHSQLGAESS